MQLVNDVFSRLLKESEDQKNPLKAGPPLISAWKRYFKAYFTWANSETGSDDEEANRVMDSMERQLKNAWGINVFRDMRDSAGHYFAWISKRKESARKNLLKILDKYEIADKVEL